MTELDHIMFTDKYKKQQLTSGNQYATFFVFHLSTGHRPYPIIHSFFAELTQDDFG